MGQNNSNLRTFTSTANAVFATYQPQKNAVMTISKNTIENFNANTCERRWSAACRQALCAEYNTDLGLIITGDSDGCLRAYEAVTGNLQMVFAAATRESQSGHTDSVVCLLYVSHDEILSGSVDGTVRLWSLSTAKELRLFTPVPKDPSRKGGTAYAAVNAIAYDPSRKVVSVGHINGIIRQYDLRTGKKLVEIGTVRSSNEISSCVVSMAVITSLDFLVFSTTDSTFRIWDLKDGTEHSRYAFTATSVLYDENRDILFTGSDDGEIVLWHCFLGVNGTRSLNMLNKLKAHNKRVTSLWYHPNTDSLVSASNEENTVRLWGKVYEMGLSLTAPETTLLINSGNAPVVDINAFLIQQQQQQQPQQQQQQQQPQQQPTTALAESEQQQSAPRFGLFSAMLSAIPYYQNNNSNSNSSSKQSIDTSNTSSDSSSETVTNNAPIGLIGGSSFPTLLLAGKRVNARERERLDEYRIRNLIQEIKGKKEASLCEFERVNDAKITFEFVLDMLSESEQQYIQQQQQEQQQSSPNGASAATAARFDYVTKRRALENALRDAEDKFDLSLNEHMNTFRDSQAALVSKYSESLFTNVGKRKIDEQYAEELQEMLKRHERELKQLKDKYDKQKREHDKKCAVAAEQAANEYLTIKDAIIAILTRVDSESSVMFHSSLGTGLGLPIVENRYMLVCPIPEPTATRVYKAVDLTTRSIVAAKELPVVLSDVRADLVHPAIVPVRKIAFSADHKKTYIIMDIMKESLSALIRRRAKERKQMLEYLQKQKSESQPNITDGNGSDVKMNLAYEHHDFTQSEIAEIIFSLLHAVHYLHSEGMVHRELKPSTVLISAEGITKVLHFGLMKTLRNGVLERDEIGNVYLAPEMLGLAITTQSDIWSIGVLFAYLLQSPEERKSNLIFSGEDTFTVLKSIVLTIGMPSSDELKSLIKMCRMKQDSAELFVRLLSLPESEQQITRPLTSLLPNAPAEAVDLISRMLQFLPTNRISEADALDHPYFEKYLQVGASDDTKTGETAK